MASKTIAEQLAALKATREAHNEKLQVITQKSIDEGRSMNDAEAQEFEALEKDVDTIDQDIARLTRQQARMQATAQPVAEEANTKAAQKACGTVAAGSGVQVKNTQKLEPGIAFARLARCKGLGFKHNMSPVDIAKNLYSDDERLVSVLSKAAVPAANTIDQPWAGFLVGDEGNLFADFVEFLRPQTILGRFGAGGIPSLRRVPFRTRLLSQTAGGDGYWVGEGKAKPLTQFAGTATTMEPLKVANIAVATMELLRDSSPSAETWIRDQLASALRERLDIDFIDPNKAAVAGESPASILNGVAAIPSSGSTADDIRCDIATLFNAFIADNNAPTSGVWIMPATVALALSLYLNPLGQPEFPGIGMNGGTFAGLPVIVSEYVPTDSSGAVVALVNASDIYLADDGGIEVSVSDQASLQMDDAPTNASYDDGQPVPTTLVSLWQTNSVGFRAERTVNWARRRPTSVAYLTGVNWTSCAP